MDLRNVLEVQPVGAVNPMMDLMSGFRECSECRTLLITSALSI